MNPLNRTRITLLTLALLTFIHGALSAQGYNWIEAPATLANKTMRLSLGGYYNNNAPFPFAGLEGDLYGVGWVEGRFAPSDNVELFATCTIRKIFNVSSVTPAAGDVFLDPPAQPGQTRSATGDLSLYTKWRITSLGSRYEFGILTGFTLPNTNLASGLGLDIGELHGRAMFGINFDRLKLTGTIGAALSNNPSVHGQDDFFVSGVGALFQAFERLSLSGELYGAFANDDGIGDGIFDSLNLALGATLRTRPFDVTLNTIFYFEDTAPSSGFRLRFSRNFIIGKP